jgi:hypothetical protein
LAENDWPENELPGKEIAAGLFFFSTSRARCAAGIF